MARVKQYPWANRPEYKERSANLQHYQQPCNFCLQDTVNILFSPCFTLNIERDEIRKALLIKMILLVLVTVEHSSTTATFFVRQTVHTLTLIKTSLQRPPVHYGMFIINRSNRILILFHWYAVVSLNCRYDTYSKCCKPFSFCHVNIFIQNKSQAFCVFYISINYLLLDYRPCHGFRCHLTREKLLCLYENLMSNNFRKTAVLKKISIVN